MIDSYYSHSLHIPSYSSISNTLPLTDYSQRVPKSWSPITFAPIYPSLPIRLSPVKHHRQSFETPPTHPPTSILHQTRPNHTMSALSFLQIQTRAAHPPRRPANQPAKDTQVATSHSLSSSPSSPRSSADSSAIQSPSKDWARCSRCHHAVSTDGSLPSMVGVNIGTNSYYCQRCAKLVGYKT